VPVFADERLVGTLGCWREGASRPFEYSDQVAGERLAQLIGRAIVLARPTTEGPRPLPRRAGSASPPSLERLFEATNVLISTANAEGFFTRLNPAWEHTLGWSREALMAQPFTAFVHPDDVARTSLELSKTGTPGAEVVSFENRYRCEDGSYRWLSWQGMTDGSDWYSIAQDVTEQKVAAAALERSERELTAAQQVAQIGSWDWTVETDDLRWSDQLYTMLGVDHETIPSYDRYLELVHPDDRPLTETVVRAGPAADDEFRYEVRIPRPDEERVLEVRGQIIRGLDGHPTVRRGPARDVTDARRREHAHAEVIESALDCIVTTDHDGRVTEFNPAAQAVFGYTREEALGREVAELIVPSRLRAAHRLGLARAAGGEAKVLLSRVELVACRQDGGELPVELTVARTDDVPPKFIAFMRDLSQQRGAVRAARESDERFRQVVDGSGQGIWTVDLESRTTLVNPAVATMLGYEPDDMLGRGLFEFMDDEEARRVRGQIAAVYDGSLIEEEGRFLHRDGSVVWVSMRVTPLRDEAGNQVGTLAMTTNLTERRAASQQQQLLTAIIDGSDDAILGKTPGGIVTTWNGGAERLYGYSAEEAIGARLTDLIIPPERHGEHYTIVEDAASGGSVDHQETERHCKDGHRVQVSITSYPVRDPDGKLTSIAIVARNITERKAHEENLRRELESVAWISRIRTALAEDRFVLWGQPIIDLRTGETVQEELLIRMLDREGEIVPPGDFLPAAERYGLIGDIDQWVLRQATRLAAGGRSVEVNLSADSVGRPEVLTTVERELGASGADPGKIVFEITETALMQNTEIGAEFARRLSELGCQFALDDFGTGFGSFTYLKQLAVDYLKIDTEFVCELMTDPANQHVVRAVVNLAQGFKIKTVAEGVEDEATLELLRDFGVDYAQGFHIGRPAPLAAIAADPTSPEGKTP
jgi:PAS domain S-box-containing protein